MRKTIGFTTLLLIIALALGLYIYLYDSRKPTTREKNKEWEPVPLIDEEAKISGFTIIKQDEKLVINSVKGANTWLMEEPIETFVERVMINFMLTEFYKVKKERLVELNPEDLSKYQLEDPRVQVHVRFEEKPELHLLIGKMNYNQEHFFAKIEDDPTVFLVPLSLRQYVDLDFEEFRSRAVFFHLPSDVLSIEIVVEDEKLSEELPMILEPKVVVQKQPGEKKPTWSIIKPLQEEADFNVLERLFMWLTSTGAKEEIDIKDEELPEYGLDSPRAKIVIMNLDGIKEEVHFGAYDKETGDVYVRNSSRFEVLKIDLKTMAEILTLHFRKNNVLTEKARRNPTKAQFEYPRKPEKDFIVAPEKHSIYTLDGKTIDDEVMAARVRATISPFQHNDMVYLHHMKPFPDKEPYGLDKPVLNIKIWEGEELFLDVSLGNTVGRIDTMKTYIQDNIRGYIGAIDTDLYIEIPREKEDFVPTPEQLERLREVWKRMENEKR